MSYFAPPKNAISTDSFNSRAAATLAAGATFQGVGEDVSKYGRAGISIVSDNATDGVLTIEVSRDNVTWGGPTRNFANTSIAEPHMWNIVEQYFRIKYVNGTTEATNLEIQVQYSVNADILLGHQLDATLLDETEAIITRSVLVGSTDGGSYVNVPVTNEGHLEVALHDPVLPFGSIHTEKLTPIFQIDAVYGINTTEIVATTGLGFDAGPAIGSNTGSVAAGNEMFTCSTGATAYSFGSLQTRKRLRYRAGQGIVGRFAGFFSAPAASSIVVAGYGSGEAGYYYGYNGTSFGILHSTGAVREIQTFTVTNETTTGGTVTFRLNGLDSEVTLTALATPTLTANEIAQKTFPGWSVEARGATVIFLAGAAGDKAGTFSLTLGTALGTAGTFAETLAGVASTDTWIAQSSWNGDVCDGTGLSGFTLDQTKGNVFQIGIAWLGFGPVTFKVMIPNVAGNNASWVTVHTVDNPNTRITPHMTQPSFPFTAAASSAGSTTDVSVSIGSIAGFVEGDIRLTGPRSSFSDTSQAVTTTNYYTLFSIRNDSIFGHTGVTERANQAIVNILSFGGAHDDATPVIFYLLKNATLVGPANWTKWSSSSCIYTDTGATTCTITDNIQIVQVIPVGQTGTILAALEDTTTLQPGETLTVAATAVTGTSTWTIATLNTREDQ
tara:strand:+ start:23952 stop:25955 length:2004 start_codon:yes stop_codon:yes gene_type:complete